MTDPEKRRTRLKTVAVWSVMAGALASSILTLVAVYSVLSADPDLLKEIVREQARAIFGLPFAMISSFCIVLFLEASTGPIEFEALGFKFKGGSGPVVLCIACFLSLVIALLLLWT